MITENFLLTKKCGMLIKINADTKMFKNRGVFGEIFIKFARKINLSLLKYDEQKLKIFCELSKINYEERYNVISNKLKLMNSFVCYLKTEELIGKTKNIEIPKVSDFLLLFRRIEYCHILSFC